MVQIKQSIQTELLYLPTPAGKAPAQWIQSSRCEGRYVSSCGWCLPESRLIGQAVDTLDIFSTALEEGQYPEPYEEDFRPERKRRKKRRP